MSPLVNYFQKSELKVPPSFRFSKKLEKLNLRLQARFSSPKKCKNRISLAGSAHSNENYSRFSIPVASKPFYYLSLGVKMKSQVLFLMC